MYATKSADGALNMMFFCALVLILLTKFVLKTTVRRCSFGNSFLYYDAILVPNTIQKLQIGKEPNKK